MLYLIRSFTRTGTFLKVGYTANIERRMGEYLVENPGRELISIRAGDLTEETRMHLYLTSKLSLFLLFIISFFCPYFNPNSYYCFHKNNAVPNSLHGIRTAPFLRRQHEESYCYYISVEECSYTIQ